jgi:hypothetical protein
MALFGKKMKDPVNGTARVINNGGLKATVSGAIRVPLDLMVEADAISAHLVHVVPRHPESGKWPSIGQTLPVVLDRADPQRVEILWDQVPSLMDTIKTREAQRLEDAQRGQNRESGPVVVVGGTQGGPAMGAAPQDPADELAKLADLRDRGALTDDEFQTQKKRVLSE